MDEQTQCWLWALSAPMVALNPGASYGSAGFYADNSPVDLKQGWGIANRDELLAMLRMADDGHASHLNDAYWQWQRCLPSEWQALLAGLPARQRTLYQFASQTAGECGHGGIRSWDLGRMSFLLRCGLSNGFVNRDESLWLHGRLALRARYYYDSWNAYVAGFLMGHSFWQCLNNSDAELADELARQGSCAGNQSMLRELALNPAVPFAELPWELSLALPDKPDSLAEFTWS